MDSKATAKSKTTTKAKASTVAKARITNSTRAKVKTQGPKTKAVIYNSDSEAMEEDEAVSEGEDNAIDSFNISRRKKLTVGRFKNGDAFVDIRESHPRTNISKRLRRGRGICLTLTQWRKILGLIPEIEKSINQIASKKNT